MARKNKLPSRSLLLYSYEYEHSGSLVRVNAFWDSRHQVRNEIKTQRTILLRQGRELPLPDMRILEIETIPIDERAIVRLLNEEHEGLDVFFRSQTVIEVVSVPK